MAEDRRLAAEAVIRDLDRLDGEVAKHRDVFIIDNSRGIPDDVRADERTMFALTIGSRFDLISMHAVQEGVRTWKEMRARFPDSPIYICVLGYDDDPREIADIPEAARFFRRWAKLARIRTPEEAEAQKLDDVSIGTLMVCGAFGRKLQEEARSVAPRSASVN